MSKQIDGQINIDGEEEVVGEKRTFTVTVDFTIDLDAIKEEVCSETISAYDGEEMSPEQIEKRNRQAEEDVQSFWIKTDMELVDIVMSDLEDTLEEIGMRMKPTGFKRGS